MLIFLQQYRGGTYPTTIYLRKMPTFTKRDREVAREIHRLFRTAWWQDKPDWVFWFFTRPPAMFIYNILIPFQVAYGLQAIITKDFESVRSHAVTILVLTGVYGILWTLGGIAIIRNARYGARFIQERIFRNYLEKDYEFLSNTHLGILGSQAAKLRQSLDEYDQIFFNGFINEIIVVVSSVAIIAYQSLLLAVVSVAAMLGVLSFTFAITRWRIKYRRLLSEAESEMSGVIVDALGHGTTVKSFAAEDFEQQRLSKSITKFVKVQGMSWLTSIPADVGRVFLAGIATFLLLIFTARLYKNGSISIAIVVLVQLYVVKLIASTQTIANLIKSYEATMSSAHQAVKTMLIAPTVLDPVHPKSLPKDSPLTISFEKVSLRYKDAPKGIFAIKDFNLSIAPGKRIGIVGYSGSGKTTLTKILLRFMDVSKGSIKVSGIDIRDLSQKELRQVIAYVPQEPLLFHRSIFENIAYGRPRAPKAKVIAAAEAAYITEFTRDMTKGLQTIVGERGVKLSGGQRQRVAIARALLKDSPILVLDEATSALDSKSEQYIQKALWKLMKGRTALVIAHRLSTIQRMDTIIVMDKGNIVEAGSHEELLDKEGVYARLWQHQSGGYIVDPAAKSKPIR